MRDPDALIGASRLSSFQAICAIRATMPEAQAIDFRHAVAGPYFGWSMKSSWLHQGFRDWNIMASESGHEEFFGVPRRAHAGRTFVYVLRCQGEDLLKVGCSHQPTVRFHALHPRFYAFFDLEESFLIETDRLKDARRIERLFIERWPEHQAPAPLTIRPAAGGHTEWFRGVGDSVFEIAQRLAERYGYSVHAPVRLWLRAQMMERADLLFAWSDRLFQIIDWQDKNQHDQARDPRYRRMLCDALDAMESVGIESKDLVPEAVHRWYLANGASRS